MYQLKNDRLTVSVAVPGKEYPTSRFDRAGFITQVRLDDKYDFLGQEDMLDGSPSSGGMGLCSEIQCDPLSETVAVGKKFPKFGVGNLTKPTQEPYFFMTSYESDDYDIQVTASDTEIQFFTAPKTIGGYGISQKKSIVLDGNKLIMTYSVKNEGSNPIHFEEYCHNFISLNHKKVCKDYYLTIPCVKMPVGEIKTPETATTLLSDGTGLSKSRESMVYSLYAFSEKEMQSVPSYGWKMEDKENGLCIQESDDFIPTHVTVWSVGDVMSPEMFFTASLAPGEETSWTRTWTFDAPCK